MSKLFKLLALFLSIGLVAAACGSDSGDEGTSTTAAPTTAATADTETTAAPTTAVELVEGTSLLQVVQDRGTVNCGVGSTAVAFSVIQPDGTSAGFDADYCRVIAAAVLGDATAVTFIPLTSSERFTAVQTGQVDLLMRTTTWTQSRDTDLGMDFGPTTYFDGQQLMARISDGFSGSSDIADPKGTIVCVNAGTTTEKNISEAARLQGVNITLQTFEGSDEVYDSFISGACDVTTTDGSALVGRMAKHEMIGEWIIFPATPISKEPLGPVYPQNDSVWGDVINWSVYATVIADEYGINNSNVDDFLTEPGEVGRLLGTDEGELQTVMGLPADAFYQVIKQVGNYSDIYNSNLNPVGLFREGSANAPAADGGLIYAPPMR
ncbi:MAG: amino acid ABC transporter substrate-binding protein [Acidimicrobiales bacterium]